MAAFVHESAQVYSFFELNFESNILQPILIRSIPIPRAAANLQRTRSGSAAIKPGYCVCYAAVTTYAAVPTMAKSTPGAPSR